MKRIIILLAMILPFLVQAQTPTCVRTAANQVTTDAGITNALPGCNCVTPLIVGTAFDSIYAMLCDLSGTISSATGLQGVLNAGNTADNGGGASSFALSNLVNGNSTALSSNGLLLTNGSSGLVNIQSGTGVGQPSLSIYDRFSGNYCKLLSQPFTGIWNVTLPNESGNLVTHTTSSSIIVGTIGTGGSINTNSFTLKNGGTSQAVLGFAFGNAFLQLKDASSAFYSNFQSGIITSTHSYTTEDRSGPLALGGDGLIPTVTAGTGAGTTATITLTPGSDDVSGTIDLFTGATPASGVMIAQITYNTAYTSLNAPTVTFSNASDDATAVLGLFIKNAGANLFELWSGTGISLIAAKHYQWNYHVCPHP